MNVTTLTMNMPARLNGWTLELMDALRSAMREAAADAQTKVVILTGADPYYCAGVNLGATIQLAHPRTLRKAIVEHNQALFDGFLDFPKPILIAANGPAIGASVTSATLCDGIIASERATFSTPFAALGVTPEGCSSVLFPRLLGQAAATRMLGPEGWKPTAAEALAAGLVQWVVPHEELLARAQSLAETWIEAGATRSYRGGFARTELKAVNASESEVLADAFLSTPFLKAQFEFLWRKKKRRNAAIFLGLWLSHPLWSKLL
jgi:enoyl-CoA hydratase/carnithine racemase